MISFEHFKFSDDLRKSIERLGYQSPTKIQEESIPLILAGRDMLGESETGSGKTLAFGSGVIENTARGKGLQALILTPTRELAEQVKVSLCKLAYHKQLKITAIYGGVSFGPQFRSLKSADIVVATPGRFKDHLQRGTVNTSNVSILVLDEADRMLDMGFIDDIEMIINSCPNRKQTLFFSATIPPQIEKLSKRYLKRPIKVSTRKHVDSKKLKQGYFDVPRSLKFSLLLHLLRDTSSKLAMVFCNTRRTTDVVIKHLKIYKVDAVALHGGFPQNKRTEAIENFKEGKIHVLVCTDVAARGIHVDNISHIYNYDIPSNPIDYVHRIGRTARAGEEGQVINLLSEEDHDNFSRILCEYRFSINKLKKPYVERVVFCSHRTSSSKKPRMR
ncbi:ATP-dependent helicase [Candidatus Woesearchaeota archaeon]|nr:MAG: ATP-dependent helicase [Candidatus Woesearchaeota archaeon]